MKHSVIGFAFAALLLIAAPLATSAQGADMQSQISALLTQIKVLQQIIAQLSAQADVASTLPAPVVQPGWYRINRQLAIGTQGIDVSDLQSFLREKGYFNGAPTGYFGNATAVAVSKWQANEGIDPVGVVGPVSRSYIFKKWCTAGVGPTACTKEYKPVRGSALLPCGAPAGAPSCDALSRKSSMATYSNRCMLNASGATYLYDGECQRAEICSALPPPPCPAGYEAKWDYDDRGCRVKSTCVPFGITCRGYFSKDDIVREFTEGERTSCIPGQEQGSRSCVADAYYVCRSGTWKIEGGLHPTANTSPVITSFSGPTTLNVNQTGTWKVEASDPENGTLQYSIHWGDETRASTMLGAGAETTFTQNTSFTHRYAAAGTYTVSVTVHDQYWLSASISATVKVGNEPVACTKEYKPLCGRPPQHCTCPPSSEICLACVDVAQMTYGNRCALDAERATFLYEGECRLPTVTCRGYDSSSKGALKEFTEGERTSCIPAVGADMECIADAHYVCHSGVWKTEGGLPPAS